MCENHVFLLSSELILTTRRKIGQYNVIRSLYIISLQFPKPLS